MVELTQAHYEELLAIENGADIIGYSNAKLLREVQQQAPQFITICEVMGDYLVTERLPYFGAIATADGAFHAKRQLAKLKKLGK